MNSRDVPKTESSAMAAALLPQAVKLLQEQKVWQEFFFQIKLKYYKMLFWRQLYVSG